jgi:hypothetical protein
MKNKLDFFSEHELGYFLNIFSSNFTKINPIENCNVKVRKGGACFYHQILERLYLNDANN